MKENDKLKKEYIHKHCLECAKDCKQHKRLKAYYRCPYFEEGEKKDGS